MKRPAMIALCLLGTACAGDASGDGAQPEMDCADTSVTVSFDEADPPFADLHHAIELVPGEYATAASWLGEEGTTVVTMSLGHEGESYEVSVADLGLHCSVSLDVPMTLSLATDDGKLAVVSVSTWVQAPGLQSSEDVHLVAVLSADPNATDWLTVGVAQMWPEIASPDDAATLWLELESGGDRIQGRLDYEKREIVDGSTVVYHRDTLLEWDAPRTR